MSEPLTLGRPQSSRLRRGPEQTVVVDDVHLTYRIVGKAGTGGAPAALRRLLLREQAPGQRSVHAVRGVSSHRVPRRGDRADRTQRIR